MSPLLGNPDDEEEYDPYDEEDDDESFADDMEALKKACMLTGTTLPSPSPSAASDGIDGGSSPGGGAVGLASNSDGEDDFELLRSIQNRLSVAPGTCERLSLKPFCALPMTSDDEDDDYQTLCAVRRRFSAYERSDSLRKERGNFSTISELVHQSTLASEVLPDAEEFLSGEMQLPVFEPMDQSNDCNPPSSLPLNYSSFPKSAQLFIDAIKRNRSLQKFFRSKLTQIEARIEENKKLKQRVKVLKNLQSSCRKITGLHLARRKDPRFKLISARRTVNSKGSGKKSSAIFDGPVENSHAANYRMALKHFPLSLNLKKWTEEEKKNLANGIRQQFQEMVFQLSLDHLSGSEGSLGNANNLDGVLTSIRDLEITPEQIREFLPKVNWDQLASLYIAGRTGAECEAQWLNFEDPLINWNQWTVEEDKKLLFLVQEKGITNWFDIAVSLGTNRTPSCCLRRFQRSLNAGILKSEWSNEEDAQLRIAVETYGESDWQSVASSLEGRTGTQCSNRWRKTLHPDRKKLGRWTVDEDKLLKVAVKLFGPKNWPKIAQFVSGRTQVQCRERWVNSLDPSLNWNKWTEEEDLRLKTAIAENGYLWSKVAECVPGRTDNQCMRRWRVLSPNEVPLLQAARRIKKSALLGNFVDRESERPALGPNDFIPLPMIGQAASESENLNQSSKRKRKSSNVLKIRSKRGTKRVGISASETPGVSSGTEVDILSANHSVVTGSTVKSNSESNTQMETAGDHLSTNSISRKSIATGDIAVYTRKKKQLPKSHSRGNVIVEKEGIINGDVLQTFGGRSSSNCKRRPHKLPSRRKVHGKSGITANDAALVHGHVDSNLLVTTCEGDGPSGVVGQPVASGETVHEPPTTKELCIGSAEDGECLVSAPEEFELINIELAGVGHTPCHQDSSRRRRPPGKANSKKVLRTMDDSDVTLASFLRNNKSKRRNLEVTKIPVQGCSSSEMSLGSNLHLNDRNTMHCEAQAFCGDDGFLETASGCEKNAHHSKKVKLVAHQGGALTGSVSINHEGDLGDDGITLASLERRKVKNRRSVTAGSGKLPLRKDTPPCGTVARQEGDTGTDDITLASFVRRKLKKHPIVAETRAHSTSHQTGGSKLPSEEIGYDN